MDINELTPEQIKSLEAQLAEKRKAEKQKMQAEKETLRSLQNEFIDGFFPKLTAIAENLTLSKAELFENVTSILQLKKQILGISDDEFNQQQSHSISNEDFSKTIIIGHNVIDGWDLDTAQAGVSRVNEWLTSKMTEDNTELIGIIRNLLKPNKDGFLKAQRVLELRNNAEKIGDTDLIEAVKMIQDSYQPTKTSTFVKAKFKGEDGKDIWLNLSMSNA